MCLRFKVCYWKSVPSVLLLLSNKHLVHLFQRNTLLPLDVSILFSFRFVSSHFLSNTLKLVSIFRYGLSIYSLLTMFLVVYATLRHRGWAWGGGEISRG